MFSYIFLAHLAQTENEVFFLVTVSHSIGARHLWHMQGDHEGDTHTPRSRALSEACTPKLARPYPANISTSIRGLIDVGHGG